MRPRSARVRDPWLRAEPRRSRGRRLQAGQRLDSRRDDTDNLREVTAAPEKSAVSAPIVGRDAELAAIEEWLDDAHGSALLIEGEAGIGKTTLWREAVYLAGEYRVLTSGSVEAEARLSSLLVSTTSSKASTTRCCRGFPARRPARSGLPFSWRKRRTTPSREPSPPRSSARYASWPVTARCSSPSTTSSG